MNPYPSTAEEEMVYNRIREIAETEEVHFRNTNYDSQEIGLDHNKVYSDDSHLNYYGSHLYSSFLGRLLKQEFDLPDRRNEPGYDSWDRNVIQIRELYGE